MPTPLENLKNELASSHHRLIVLAGAGVACATDDNPCNSWRGLLTNGLDRCRERCHTLTYQWLDITQKLIEENTPDGLISAAGRIRNKLTEVHTNEYARWLADSVGALRLVRRETIDAILTWRTRIATTNYDNLFEEASGLKPVVWADGLRSHQVLRGDEPGILHLHGHYSTPNSVVFDARTYEDVCRDVNAQNMLRAILTRDTVVFVGCGDGLQDPNFSALLTWARIALEQCSHSHYHLVRQSDLRSIAGRYKGLPIEPIAYGTAFTDLPGFLLNINSHAQTPTGLAAHIRLLDERQTDFDTQRHSLDGNTALSPSEYIRRSFELARELWNAGGLRTAALHMHGALTRQTNTLPPNDDITYSLEAVEYLLKDGLDQHALSLMNRVESLLLQTAPDSPSRAHYHRLLSRCFTARADLDRLQSVAAVAMTSATPTEKNCLKAEIAEYYMLSGDIAQAERDLCVENDK